MCKAGGTRLEMELARHYTSQREDVTTQDIDRLVQAMVTEDSRMRRMQPRRMGAAEFVVSQARFIPAWTWVVQVALVVLMCAMAYAAGDASSTKVTIGILSAMCVLVGVPTVQASKLHGVVELEYACPHNAASVMVARLIVLGCSSAMTVALMVGVTASRLDASAFDVALWACPPFFGSCAGSLLALRKAPPSVATTFCVAWIVTCSAALLTLANTLPDLYAHTSVAVWTVASACGLIWLLREFALTLRSVSEGLDAFSPHLARTNN